MRLNTKFLLGALFLGQSALGSSSEPRALLYPRPPFYTLSVYAPARPKYNGLKLNAGYGLSVQRKVGGYCPEMVKPNCPNGTQTAFSGTLSPSVMVPGGQESYVAEDGILGYTSPHSISIPLGAYATWQGWTWTALPKPPGEGPHYTPNCPRSSADYRCQQPWGYLTFKLSDAENGGVRLCTNPYFPDSTELDTIYAVTPKFNRTGCISIKGMATHNYTGPVPPVWEV